jgi:hypothetical protein
LQKLKGRLMLDQLQNCTIHKKQLGSFLQNYTLEAELQQQRLESLMKIDQNQNQQEK